MLFNIYVAAVLITLIFKAVSDVQRTAAYILYIILYSKSFLAFENV